MGNPNAFDNADAAEAYAAERRAEGHRDAHVVLDACGWVAHALEGDTVGPLGVETAWRWENPETGAFDPAAARRARKAGAR